MNPELTLLFAPSFKSHVHVEIRHAAKTDASKQQIHEGMTKTPIPSYMRYHLETVFQYWIYSFWDPFLGNQPTGTLTLQWWEAGVAWKQHRYVAEVLLFHGCCVQLCGGFHGHGGTPIAGWFIYFIHVYTGKSHSDRWLDGVPPWIGHHLVCYALERCSSLKGWIAWDQQGSGSGSNHWDLLPCQAPDRDRKNFSSPHRLCPSWLVRKRVSVYARIIPSDANHIVLNTTFDLASSANPNFDQFCRPKCFDGFFLLNREGFDLWGININSLLGGSSHES